MDRKGAVFRPKRNAHARNVFPYTRIGSPNGELLRSNVLFRNVVSTSHVGRMRRACEGMNCAPVNKLMSEDRTLRGLK